jgi:hypothetical protein
VRQFIIIGAALFALAAPALAQQPAGAPASDTLKAVTTKGIVLSVAGMDIDVKYTPDGKFTAMDGQVTGEWRTDGEKLCTRSNMAPDEECTVYPTGKKSGDSFDLTSAQGTATIKIK